MSSPTPHGAEFRPEPASAPGGHHIADGGGGRNKLRASESFDMEEALRLFRLTLAQVYGESGER